MSKPRYELKWLKQSNDGDCIYALVIHYSPVHAPTLGLGGVHPNSNQELPATKWVWSSQLPSEGMKFGYSPTAILAKRALANAAKKALADLSHALPLLSPVKKPRKRSVLPSEPWEYTKLSRTDRAVIATALDHLSHAVESTGRIGANHDDVGGLVTVTRLKELRSHFSGEPLEGEWDSDKRMVLTDCPYDDVGVIERGLAGDREDNDDGA